MRYLHTLILAFIVQLAYGILDAPVVLRACINNKNKTVTLSWKKPTDLCNSFVKYFIYSQLDANPYQKIQEINDINTTEYFDVLPDLNTNRKYYITVHTLCDGLDSAISNVVSIDQSFPNQLSIDSVSYDFATQDIIVGWPKNPAPDTKGYQVYRFSGGIGDSIGYTTDTFFTASKNPSTVFQVVIATEDSCGLYAPLSDPHRVCFLSSTIDTCARTINLNWNLYSGWQQIDSQLIMINKNHQGFSKLTQVNGSTNSFLYNDFILGDTICFFIRAYTSNNSIITSSSNRICIETRKLNVPSYLYLSNVSVNNNNIELEWELDNVKDQTNFKVEKGLDPSTLMFNQNITTSSNTTDYNITDTDVDVNLNSYNYRITSVNKCNEETAVSNISNSILFVNPFLSSHNSYLNWDGGVMEYQLEFKNRNGSTWNTVFTDQNILKQDINDSNGCFRIKAIENVNSYNYNKISYSNEICIEPKLDIDYPTGINTSSTNNRFIIIGEGIDHSQSYYQFYNRWGEQLVNNSTSEPWNLTYKGKLVEPGTYVFVLHVIGLKGEKENIKGTIYVIR